MNNEIFISYAWGGKSEDIVNELDNSLKKDGIVLVRDKRDLGFKGLIIEFMKKIGLGDAIIIVISDKYLKSPYCMFELLEIYRNQNFKERIYPIVLEDANIFEPIPRLQYLKYWQDKKKELDDAIMQFGTDAITVIGDDYKTYKKVFDNFGEVINILKDINSLTPDIHQADDFAILKSELLKQIGNFSQENQRLITPEEKKSDIDNDTQTHYDITVLFDKSKAELQIIAQKIGLNNISDYNEDDLVYKILETQKK